MFLFDSCIHTKHNGRTVKIFKKSYLSNKSCKMKKDKVIDTIKSLPEEFELDELLEKLIFIEKVDMGLTQVEEGKVITHESVKEIVKQW